MRIQSNINNGIYQAAVISKLNDLTSMNLQYNSVEELKCKLHDIDVEIAKLHSLGIDAKPLEQLHNEYEGAINRYYEELKIRTKQQNRRITIAAFSILIAFILIMVAVFYVCRRIDEEQSGAYIYSCPNCGSYDTRGFSTFWTNDGNLCHGSEEYVRTHADYSIFTCNNCSHNFKVYKNQWKVTCTSNLKRGEK